MSLEEEMSNPSDEEIIRILHQRLQTAKEDSERYRQEANNASELAQKNLDKYFKAKEENEKLKKVADIAMKMKVTWDEFDKVNESEINTLTQQNKQMREALEKMIVNLKPEYYTCPRERTEVIKNMTSIAQQALAELRGE